MKNKAIITTSANPFHYGHLDIYKKAKKIFDDVTVIVAYNRKKTSGFDEKRITAHLEAYNIPFEILSGDCKTVADYCMQNNINYVVRGIRNGVDAEYELKIDFVNREIFPNLQTVFLPTSDTFSNISSSVIRELLVCDKEDIAMQYMSPAALKIYVALGKGNDVYTSLTDNSED